MSIATREAAESYPFKGSFTEHGNERTNLRREGYIAGRTAEPTEAEIEEVAKEIAKTNFKVASVSKRTPVTGTYTYDWHFYVNNAKSALIAARKAVAE